MQMDSNALKNKRILITGASSGIGRALTFKLAEKGTQLIIVSRDYSRLKKLAEILYTKFPHTQVKTTHGENNGDNRQ